MSRNVKTTIVVDGSCSGNPGPGGWAAILLHGEAEKVVSGGAAMTTKSLAASSRSNCSTGSTTSTPSTWRG